ncbi:MAG: hypothetical protein H0V53_00050 [Rubrobacter sp.]|jgi:hypothetical protein|nr:hypothetical protein [Rubrobacter sp.]
MARRTEEQNERQEQPRQKGSPTSSSAGKKRKPRGALFHGDDPTLAKRTEEELHTFGR